MIVSLFSYIFDNYKVFLIIHCIICLFGIIFFINGPYEFIPESKYIPYEVNTSFGRNSPEIVDSLITTKLFESLQGSNHIKNLYAISSHGLSRITFESKKENEFSLREKIRNISVNLPPESGTPVFLERQFTEKAFMKIIILNCSININVLHEELLRIPGILNIRIPEQDKDLTYSLDLEKLNHSGLNIDEVHNFIKMESSLKPVGNIPEKGKVINLLGAPQVIDEFIPFRIPLSSFLNRNFQEEKNISIYNGNFVKVLEIYTSSKENISSISIKVRGILDKFEKSGYLKYEIYYDKWSWIKDGLAEFLIVLSISNILGSTLISKYLKNLSIFFWYLSATTSTFLYIIFFYVIIGKKISLYSLMGISLGTGVLFDYGNTILFSLNNRKGNLYLNISVIIRSSFYSMITTLIIFFPNFFLNSIISDMYFEISFSICITIFFGFINYYLLFSIREFLNQSESYHFDKTIYLSKFNYKSNKLFLYVILLLFIVHIPELKNYKIYPTTREKSFYFNIKYPISEDISHTNIMTEIDNSIRKFDFISDSLGIFNNGEASWILKVKEGDSYFYFEKIKESIICDKCILSYNLLNPYFSGIYDKSTKEIYPIDTELYINNKLYNLNDHNIIGIYSPSDFNSNKKMIQLDIEKLSLVRNFNKGILSETSEIKIPSTDDNQIQTRTIHLKGNPLLSEKADFYKTMELSKLNSIHRVRGLKFIPVYLEPSSPDYQEKLSYLEHIIKGKIQPIVKRDSEVINEILISILISFILLIILIQILYSSLLVTFILGSCILFGMGFAIIIPIILGIPLNSGSLLGVMILSGMSVDPILLVLEKSSSNSNIEFKYIFKSWRDVFPIVNINILTTALGSLSVLFVSGIYQFQSAPAISIVGGVIGIYIYYSYIFPYLLIRIKNKYGFKI